MIRIEHIELRETTARIGFEFDGRRYRATVFDSPREGKPVVITLEQVRHAGSVTARRGPQKRQAVAALLDAVKIRGIPLKRGNPIPAGLIG